MTQLSRIHVLEKTMIGDFPKLAYTYIIGTLMKGPSLYYQQATS